MNELLDVVERFANGLAWILLESAPFLFLGFLAAGVLKVLLPDSLLQRHLGRHSVGSVIKAALLGAPLPLCSCGVIGVAVGLRRSGVSRGATQSFLISTPETSVDSIAITYAMLGPAMAIARPVIALATAITAGLIEVFVGVRDPSGTAFQAVSAAGSAAKPSAASAPDAACCASTSCGDTSGTRAPESISASAPASKPRRSLLTIGREIVTFSFVTMTRDLWKYLAVGLLLSALVIALLPNDFFTAGGGALPDMPAWGWMLILLALSVPMYVCATASTPLAAALILKGLSPGAALVFLLAGPATNAATLLIVGRELGRRSVAIYLMTIGALSMVAGLAVDALWPALPSELAFAGAPALVGTGEHGEMAWLPEWLRVTCAVAFVAMLIAVPTIDRMRHPKRKGATVPAPSCG